MVLQQIGGTGLRQGRCPTQPGGPGHSTSVQRSGDYGPIASKAATPVLHRWRNGEIEVAGEVDRPVETAAKIRGHPSFRKRTTGGPPIFLLGEDQKDEQRGPPILAKTKRWLAPRFRPLGSPRSAARGSLHRAFAGATFFHRVHCEKGLDAPRADSRIRAIETQYQQRMEKFISPFHRTLPS